MKRAEITRLAVAADLYSGFVSVTAMERFAHLVAAAEREACARMFDGEVWSYDYREIAAKIRARGKQE
jgi:hypothetical protein